MSAAAVELLVAGLGVLAAIGVWFVGVRRVLHSRAAIRATVFGLTWLPVSLVVDVMYRQWVTSVWWVGLRPIFATLAAATAAYCALWQVDARWASDDQQESPRSNP